MVYLTNHIIFNNKKFERKFIARDVSKLSNEEIKEHLAVYDIPEHIASLWPRKKEEYISGQTGELVYFGAAGNKIAGIKGDYWEGRKIYFDTYYSKVLAEAFERGMIKLYNGKNSYFLSDIYSIKLVHALRKSAPELERKLRALDNYQIKSDEAMRNDRTQVRAAI